jgi:hypothetical protein
MIDREKLKTYLNEIVDAISEEQDDLDGLAWLEKQCEELKDNADERYMAVNQRLEEKEEAELNAEAEQPDPEAAKEAAEMDQILDELEKQIPKSTSSNLA